MSNADARARYESQVRLLLDVLPVAMKDARFALKGGTALNLFVRDLPRFSIDIDLTYLPVEPRPQTISTINELLEKAAKDIEHALKGARVNPTHPFASGRELKLIISRGAARIKVEVNYILRGNVFPCAVLDLSESCRKTFAANVSVNVMSIPDLYGGKICAALDRQHPRDLFDVMLLRRNEGLTSNIRHAFLVYMLCHNRPICELLDPKWQDLKRIYQNEFVGMTTEDTTLTDLVAARDWLLETLRASLTDAEKNFLLSFKAGKPHWSMFPHPHAQNLSGILWKQKNLAEMSIAKHAAALKKLEELLTSFR